MVEALLQISDVGANIHDARGTFPIGVAIKQRDLDTAKALLRYTTLSTIYR